MILTGGCVESDLIFQGGEGVSEAFVLSSLCCCTHSFSWPIAPSTEWFFVFGSVPGSIKPLTRELNLRFREI